MVRLLVMRTSVRAQDQSGWMMSDVTAPNKVLLIVSLMAGESRTVNIMKMQA